MDQQDEIQAALKTWREGLVGLTRQSALIKFRAAKSSSLPIDSPTPDEVLARLQSGTPQPILGSEGGESSDNEPLALSSIGLHSPRLDSEIGPVARKLMRRAQAEFLDRGIAVLYVAFGILDWRDVDGTEMASPLFLVPVQLLPQGPQGTPRMTHGEDDPVLNPALALRMKEFGIDLPTSVEIEGFTVTDTLTAVREALERNTTFADWTLRETTHLGMFSFAKEAMFRDLLENEDAVLAHPIVRALATSDPSQQSSEFQFDPIDPADIDRLAPPETTPLVLDADSSQRAAVAAAVNGHTFVMDGPPGTGKSQTIANMIGALLHAGKTVLFVSEKVAALDVVRNRLFAAGLGSYLLELHSHKVSRREVAAELLKTLDNVAKPPMSMPSMDRIGVMQRREQLNAYATAMNSVRHPLNMSLHQALGLYSGMSSVLIAPPPEQSLTELTEAEFLDVKESLAKLTRAWRPAAQGTSFLWRHAIDDQSLEVRLHQASVALNELREALSINHELIAAFNLPKISNVPLIHELIEHQNRQDLANVPRQWLTDDSSGPLQQTCANLRDQLTTVAAAGTAVIEQAGVAWTAFPGGGAPITSPPPLEIRPAALPLSDLTAPTLTAAADSFERDAAMLNDRASSLSSLATALGLPPVTTFRDIDRLIRLIDLRAQNSQPDSSWFTPHGLARARAVASNLHEQATALAHAEVTASSRFTPNALSAPLTELQDRFANLHRGLKKLSSDYRADKRSVAALLTNAADVKEGINHLAEAIAWRQAQQNFYRLAGTAGGTLGTHWKERATDHRRLQHSFSVVEEVLGLTGNAVPYPLVAFMTAAEPNDAYLSVAAAARHDIGSWKQSLHPSPAIAGRPDLLLGSTADAIQWLTAHVTPMRQAAERITSVNNVTGRQHTLTEADRILTLVDNAEQAARNLRSAEPGYRTMLGDHFDFENTDLEALEETVQWAMDLRGLASGPLSEVQVRALDDSTAVEATMPAFDKWTRTRDRVVDAFASSRHPELSAEFDDFGDASTLIAEFSADTVGQQEWFEYRLAYESLAKHGLDAAVDFCIQQRLDAHDVSSVITRALLRGWSDGIIQSDERLRPLLASDRDALVEDYQTLDRSLIMSATADIVNAANRRRPQNTAMGESGVIRREGSKQRKHKPVRELMALTRNVTLSIKPVFMMSPLSVSQYLPTDLKFDVVIFDEASQVTPGDAINCIYRGESLILAGDDKQLPPTSFFERNADDDDEAETDVKDFQSVLELGKAAGAFNNLKLKWHYRSRHEDLIAFSNYKFYEGKLVTFPSAHDQGDDVGVEFFHAHGMYRRGGGSFNPIEAAKVAERVIEHFTHRPDLTLGVVTFSVAQADAVQNAIDEARVARRDLDHHFDSDDRLNGFFIRALEQVQGDERDVIIFSVGYGPDEAGKISTNFGALNKDKGWRRLNVGITRARQRVEVVASMVAGQIPPSQNENVEFFRAYLDYAEKGPKTLAVPYSSTGLDPESPFEESVIEAIRRWGFLVEPQVGAAGFRIDIGVRHPTYPGMFAIGVECDGYQYHSAPAARDRDRLRDQVLTGLGWRLHRIWGTAWYRDRAIEEQRLRSAIEKSFAAPLEGRTKRAPVIEHPAVETEPSAISIVPTWTSEYRVAPQQPLPHWVDPGATGSHVHMVDAIRILVQLEGPIHLDIAFERLREWWGIGRVGAKIRANVDLAIERAPVHRDGQFLTIADEVVSHVRTPTPEISRKVDQIHTDELALAVMMTTRDVGAATRNEVIQGVARAFGWARTGSLVERHINDAIDHLAALGTVIDTAGTLTPAEPK